MTRFISGKNGPYSFRIAFICCRTPFNEVPKKVCVVKKGEKPFLYITIKSNNHKQLCLCNL